MRTSCFFAIFILFTSFLITSQALAQEANPYVINGSATQNSCNCYTLTPNQGNTSGSVWNKIKIDLSQSFDYSFNVYLGCADNGGADGIAFLLQPLSTSIGTQGGGMGFEGVTPSVAVSLDTYQNSEYGDPYYDHIAIQTNGDLSHLDANNLAGPVQAISGNDNIEDCKWHVLRVNWNATTYTLTAYIDGIMRVTTIKDLVTDIFNGNPLVYWGFTSATGGSYNLQQFCTSLNAAYSIPTSQKYCEGTPISFTDSSTSFGNILQWYWNFGDNTTSTDKNPPAHTYAQAGTYTVQLAILANNGCVSDTIKKNITIGANPVADFSVSDTCTGSPVPLTNKSTISTGSFGSWNWVLNTGQTYTDKTPVITLNTSGQYTLELSTISTLGCASNTATKTFSLSPQPIVSITAPEAICRYNSAVLSGNSIGTTTVKTWHWLIDDTQTASTQNITYKGTDTGTFTFKLWGNSAAGCTSDTATKTVNVEEAHAGVVSDTSAMISYPLQLQATGGVTYQWTPPTNLSDPTISNPIATLTNDATYTVTVTTSAGCTASATVFIKVLNNTDIYVPNAFTPNGDGNNDVLKIVAPGIKTLVYFNIFNRWGQKVYASQNASQTWDGTINGKKMNVGSYVWMARGIDLVGRVIEKKGTILLLR